MVKFMTEMKMQEYNISENNFEQCIKCTVCTVYCPVVPVNPDYPGPKQAGPDGERLRLKKGIFFDQTLKYCLNCKRCEVACPSGVKIGDIIQAAKIKYGHGKPKLRDFMLASTDLMGSVATKVAPIVNTSLKIKPVKQLMDGILKIDHRRNFPEYSSRTFESWFRKNAAAAQEKFDRHVAYFHGCYANYNYPQLGKDFVKVMNALGYGVRLLDGEKCCGVALISNGMIDQATKNAKKNIKLMTEALSSCEAVLGTSSSCSFTIRDEYPHLLGVDNSAVRDRMELAVRFIYRLIESGKARLEFRPDFKARIAYHVPCHMEKLGWAYYSIELLKLIPNVELTVLDSQCCGIAGTYGFKKENYKTSQDIGESLFRQIEACDIDYVVTDCETCKWQIEMSTSKRCEHPISILAKALE